MVLRVTILDGYTDEPAGLGVPPYIDVYPRYAAGAIWYHDNDSIIKYITVDEARREWSEFYKIADNSDITIVIAGVVVPGRYIGGVPLSAGELVEIGIRLSSSKTLSVLAGPAAVFGMGERGGMIAHNPSELGKHYDIVVKGDIEIFLHEMLTEGIERANPSVRRKDYSLTDSFSVYGANIVKQHPNYGYNLMVELETFRGCPRSVSGGCSFCVEPLYGKPLARNPQGLIKEIETLYNLGVRGFRLGRQPDFSVYGADFSTMTEFPRPNPIFIENLLKIIRSKAPDAIIHIDNVNPGTVARYPDESKKIFASIALYLSPGNVAALGLESADEKVIQRNNLNTTPEEALKAIEIINSVGSIRGDNGLPTILPGINFVLGLPGETKETFYKNVAFLDELIKRKLMVRRINIRKVLVIPHTRLSLMWDEKILSKHSKYIDWFVWTVRHRYDPLFLRWVVPRGTILKDVYVEKTMGNITYARQMGSYPITVEIHEYIERPAVLDVEVIRHKGRSVIGKPILR